MVGAMLVGGHNLKISQILLSYPTGFYTSSGRNKDKLLPCGDNDEPGANQCWFTSPRLKVAGMHRK